MNNFHVLTGWVEPKLWLWRDKAAGATSQLEYEGTYLGIEPSGLHHFEALLDHQVQEPAHAQLHAEQWEDSQHIKNLPRTTDYRFPKDLWFAQDATRVLVEDPFAAAQTQVRIHLLTVQKYLGGKLIIWTPGRPERRVDATGHDSDGPYFDLTLTDREQHLFLFKFATAGGEAEPIYANRLWSAQDGSEVWTHSQSTFITSVRPEKKPLVVRYLQVDAPARPAMHLWQEDSDFIENLQGSEVTRGWIQYEALIYSELPHRFMFFTPGDPPQWENPEARRNVFLRDDTEVWTTDGDGTERKLGNSGVWTLEGDHELFGSEPSANKRVSLRIDQAAPNVDLAGPLTLDVWINRALGKLQTGLSPDQDGRWTFDTYPEVVTSFQFRSATAVERIERHALKIRSTEVEPVNLWVVLGRSDPVPARPMPELFKDPDFLIERPGPWVENDQIYFALHCPNATTVELIGEWTNWRAAPIALRSTRDGTYWWVRFPLVNITASLGRNTIDGVHYKFVINQTRQVQDPAADWVEDSDPESASKLVDHSRYQWRSNAWKRPGWEYLTVYQLHPSRFAQRFGQSGLAAVTAELRRPDGYLRKVGATALLLMPTCEFAGKVGWGYNPSFYYSVESSYGGPAALKELVDTCHERGIAVLLDVVFNHAGTSDNVLWSVAPESYFDGDTAWGKMINFDQPQVNHFFEKNLVYFMRHYRIDGFRFDFTRVIRFGGEWSAYVREPGSGGGWEFMKRLQSAVRSEDPRGLMMAENYPNDWDLTWPYGPMDTQWCDSFHDRLVEAAAGINVMGPLASAMTVTQAEGGGWQTATNFPESHDEVGNEPNRIVHVAGIGRGYRVSKVAAAATLCGRGIPLWFMGAESGEWRQFSSNGKEPLPLDTYENDESAQRIRNWWNKLCELRRGNPRLQGPAPIAVHFAQDRMLAFSRGEGKDLFVVLNFGDWSGWRPLGELNLPDGEYKELLNSTWGDYRLTAEAEDEQSNGGWDARLHRDAWVNIPDYGVVVLERR